MALVLRKIYLGYQYVIDDLSDKRVVDYPLMSPLQWLLIIGGYIYFVKKLGPELMRNRKPFDLKPILIVYNVLQVVFNLLLVYRGTKALSNMSWQCAPVDFSMKPEAIYDLQTAYCFYLLKLFDCLDTVFFVLRKSTRQITFLHVYHHSGMIFSCYFATRFFGGGEIIWTGYINVIVHTVMFTYYLLTVLDKEWKKSVTFKKRLTQLQLVQFILNILIYGRLLFKPDCTFPIFVPLVYIPQNVFMLFLFGEFYKKVYMKTNKSK